MFSAIIIPNYLQLTPATTSDESSVGSRIADIIEDKVTIYLPTSKYTLCVASEENIPISIKDQLIPVVIDTKFSQPVRAYQHYYFKIEDITDPTLNRELMALRSKLVYAVSENLAPDKFYFRLDTSMNDDSTRRNYTYKLYYEEIPCYTFKEDSLLDNFRAVAQQHLGPLIVSTYSLNIDRIPHWYSKEMFRDIIELGDFPMEDKIVVEGPSSGELYLFYQKESNITEDILNDLIIEIRGHIISAVNLRIFPRNSSNEFIKSRQLKSTNNKQWFIPYNVPRNINVFSTLIQLCFSLKSLDELFWFLTWMLVCPTYSFIEQELKICVGSELIRVCYATKYLPDYIRVNTASRIQLPRVTNEVRILYPDRLSQEELSKELTDKTYISFYDHGNNERALLMHSKINIPQIDKYNPSDYSLDTRINYDVDPVLA